MSHKRVEQKTLDRVEEEIAQARASIGRIQTFGGYGKEGKAAVVAFLTDAAEAMGQQRDDIMRGVGLAKSSPDIFHAVTWAQAQQEAYKNILMLLENPAKAIDTYKREIKALEIELDALKRYEQPR